MRIKCGRCNSEFEYEGGVAFGEPAHECKCPVCGFSKKDVQEANKPSKKILNG